MILISLYHGIRNFIEFWTFIKVIVIVIILIEIVIVVVLVLTVFAFVKERFHNAVEIDILGIFEGYSSLQIWLPKKVFQGRNYSGRLTLFPSSTCFVPNRSFDLRLGVLPCRVWPSRRVWCAFLSNSGLCFLVYLCSRTRSPMLSDVNRGNSCIWSIAFVDLVLVATEKVSLSGRILFGIGGRVLWVHDP